MILQLKSEGVLYCFMVVWIHKLSIYIRNARDYGCPVTSPVVIVPASGVVKKMNQVL